MPFAPELKESSLKKTEEESYSLPDAGPGVLDKLTEHEKLTAVDLLVGYGCEEGMKLFSKLMEDEDAIDAADSYYEEGNEEEAQKAFLQVLAAKEIQNSSDDKIQIIRNKNHVATLSYCQGKFVDAEKTFREILHLIVQVQGAKHPDTIHTKNNIAISLICQGNFTDAMKIFMEESELRKKVLDFMNLEIKLGRRQIVTRFMEQLTVASESD